MYVRMYGSGNTTHTTQKQHATNMAYGEPDWATPGATTPEATQNAATGGNITAASAVSNAG